MKTKEQARIQTRVDQEIKRALKLYCAQNDLTIEQGIELAIQTLCQQKAKQKDYANDK